MVSLVLEHKDYLKEGLKCHHINSLSSPPGFDSFAWTNRNTISRGDILSLVSQPGSLCFQSLDCYQAWIPDLIFTICHSSRTLSWVEMRAPMLLTLMASSAHHTPPATDSSMIHSPESGKLSCSHWTALAMRTCPPQPPWYPSHKAALCKNHLLCQQLLTKQYRRDGTHPRSWITTRRFKQEENGGSLEECLPGVRFPQIWTTEQPCPVRRKARDCLFPQDELSHSLSLWVQPWVSQFTARRRQI